MAPADALIPASSPSPSPSPSALERLQGFVSENRRTVLVCSALAALAIGTAFFVSSSSPRPATDKDKDKTRSKRKARLARNRKSASDSDGPVLEEIVPEVEQDEPPLALEAILAMSTEDRISRAEALKSRGNTHYQARRFEQAAELYTQAIRVSPKPNPVFYCNRAASYMHATPPDHARVIQDCDEALRHNPEYVKAFNRRATALEALGRYSEALRDYMAAALLEKPRKHEPSESTGRVLAKLINERAQTVLATREPRLPSRNFMSAYFGAFRKRQHPTLPAMPSQGDHTLLLALEALDAADYPHAFSLVNEALDQGVSWDTGRAEALCFRGTFKFLTGNLRGAKDDLIESAQLNPSLTQSLVKLASVYMEESDPIAAFTSFDKAIEINPEDPDIYYHRGQVCFIMGNYATAADNYTKSSELDGTFAFSHIQLAVAQYKMGQIEKSFTTFQQTVVAFPDRSEVFNYYGELFLAEGRREDAIEKFDKAIELEKAKSPSNPLPLVNKALALRDLEGARKLCMEALKQDPTCEQAMTVLGQMACDQSELAEGVSWFERQLELARTETEVRMTLEALEVTKVQMELQKDYPHVLEQMRQV